jgi:hypothetical protein
MTYFLGFSAFKDGFQASPLIIGVFECQLAEGSDVDQPNNVGVGGDYLEDRNAAVTAQLNALQIHGEFWSTVVCGGGYIQKASVERFDRVDEDDAVVFRCHFVGHWFSQSTLMVGVRVKRVALSIFLYL